MCKMPIVNHFADAQQEKPAQGCRVYTPAGAAYDEIGKNNSQSCHGRGEDARRYQEILGAVSQCHDHFSKPEHCILRQVWVIEIDLAELPLPLECLDRADHDFVRMPGAPCDAR